MYFGNLSPIEKYNNPKVPGEQIPVPFEVGTQVGWFTVEAPTKYTRHYECAAWYTDIEVQPGKYPVVLAHRQGWKNGAFRVELPGVITGSDFQPLWCGNPIGKPGSKRDRDVGKPDTYTMSFDAWDVATHAQIELLPEFQCMVVCHGRYSETVYPKGQPYYQIPSRPMMRLNLTLAYTEYRTAIENFTVHMVDGQGNRVLTVPLGTDMRDLVKAYGVRL